MSILVNNIPPPIIESSHQENSMHRNVKMISEKSDEVIQLTFNLLNTYTVIVMGLLFFPVQ